MGLLEAQRPIARDDADTEPLIEQSIQLARSDPGYRRELSELERIGNVILHRVKRGQQDAIACIPSPRRFRTLRSTGRLHFGVQEPVDDISREARPVVVQDHGMHHVECGRSPGTGQAALADDVARAFEDRRRRDTAHERPVFPVHCHVPPGHDARCREHHRSARYAAEHDATSIEVLKPARDTTRYEGCRIASGNDQHKIVVDMFTDVGSGSYLGAAGTGRDGTVGRQFPYVVERPACQQIRRPQRFDGSRIGKQGKAIDQQEADTTRSGSCRCNRYCRVNVHNGTLYVQYGPSRVNGVGTYSAGPPSTASTPPSVMRYSGLRILKEGLLGNRGWQPTWRDVAPKSEYDVIIIGAGGHGLATAHYLAREHGIKRVAVLERGWLGSGNIGRNTTIIRSNYLQAGNQPFYELSMKLWEGLEQDVGYNAMVSQRGILNLCHSDAQRDAYARRGNAMRLAGSDAELLDRDGVKRLCPFLNFEDARFPIVGGLHQPRAGTARHDAVAWGYAHAADRRGVDIVQNCEVTGFRIADGRCQGVETTRGTISARKVAVCVAGSSGRVMAMAGMRLPIESHVLQAFVTEGLKPLVPGVVTFGAGHFYISQSDKGGLVFGGDIDGYNSYAQRGNLPVVEDVCEGGMALMPMIGRARLLRMWGGVMDMSMDGSPYIDKTSVDGLFFNGGWCYGGFKATPASGWCTAHLIATGEPHPVAAGYRLDRFRRGAMIDERGAGAQANLH